MAKILVVDDDSSLRQSLGEYLQLQGHTVIRAGNGMEALRLAYREKPDLALLDVMMAGMDGWELTARLRELSDLPVILVTARDSESDKLRGFRLGVDDYVTKPFSYAELAARIQAVLGRAGSSVAQRPNLIAFGGEDGEEEFVLDLHTRELRRGREAIPLTPTEYRLLEYLARGQGRAIPETELIREVWGTYHQEETAAVRRYIWMLRQKLEADPADPRLVLTVRGYGYRLSID